MVRVVVCCAVTVTRITSRFSPTGLLACLLNSKDYASFISVAYSQKSYLETTKFKWRNSLELHRRQRDRGDPNPLSHSVMWKKFRKRSTFTGSLSGLCWGARLALLGAGVWCQRQGGGSGNHTNLTQFPSLWFWVVWSIFGTRYMQ